MKTTLLSFLASLLFIGSPGTTLAEFKVATVDLNRILNESTEAVEQRKALDTMSKQAKSKIDAKKQSIGALEKKIKEQKLGDDSKEVKEINTQIQAFNKLVKDSEDEIKGEFMKINKTLTDKALKLITDYATKKDLDLVMDRSEKQRGPVLYGEAGVDITPEIIRQMNQS